MTHKDANDCLMAGVPPEAGQRAAADIIAEIGPRRCRLVSLPEKETQGS